MSTIYQLEADLKAANDAILALRGREQAWTDQLVERDTKIILLEALINTPEIENFDKAVPLEAAHQVVRWTLAHDDQKSAADWVATIAYLAAKAAMSMATGNWPKAKHHTITIAAVARNWHARIRRLA